MTSRTGRPRWWVAGSLLVVAVATVLLTVMVLVLDEDADRVPVGAGPAPGDRPAARPALAASALHLVEHAVESGEVTGLDAVAPDAASRALLVAVVANARDLEVDDFSLRYVDEVGAVGPDGSWQAAVDVTWAFDGYDDAPASTEVVVAFAPAGDAVGVESFGGEVEEGRRTPVWLTGRVHVVREEGVLVLAAQSRRVARAYADRVRDAYPLVREVLPRWRSSVVVEVPGSAAGLDAALGSAPGSYSAVAAVTATVDGSSDPDAPVHVFVNPEVSGGLRDEGTQVVMTHEVVHVATDAALSPVPLWLLEGFADYVALREVRLPLSVTAARIARDVRRDGPPDGLPGPAEFDPSGGGLEAVYESAWLACLVLVGRVGEDGLLRVYRAADGGTPVAAALRDEGIEEQRLVRLWRERLRDVALR